jgi:hypothetical protein
MSRYFFSLTLLLMVPILLIAQKGTVLPSAVRVGTDLGYIGVSMFDPEKQIFEINADIDLYKFFITADYGMARWSFDEPDFDYSSKGSYFKIGLDYNFLARDPDLNAIYFGVKYANSQFKESFDYSVVDPLYYDYTNNIYKTNLGAYWIEANFGMKIRVWKQLYMGWAGRIKFARKIQSGEYSMGTFYIPGYGKAVEDTRWGFNYQIMYRIPFREKPPYKPKKVKVTRDEKETEELAEPTIQDF